MDADGDERPRADQQRRSKKSAPSSRPTTRRCCFSPTRTSASSRTTPTTLFVVPAAGGTPRALFPDLPYAIEQATWAPDGNSILAVVNMGVHSEVFRIDVRASGRMRQLTDGATLHPVQAGRLVPSAGPDACCSSTSRPGSATSGRCRSTGTVDADAGDRPLRPPRTRLRAAAAGENRRGRARTAPRSRGCCSIRSTISRARRYPLVVQLHGGPMESDKFGAGAGPGAELLPGAGRPRATRCFRPNYRGSTGYGSAFYRDVVGGYFRNMHLGRPGRRRSSRPARRRRSRSAGRDGLERGRHLSTSSMTMTDRFKAGSAGAGVANWMSLYAQTDKTSFRITWFGGHAVGEERAASISSGTTRR